LKMELAVSAELTTKGLQTPEIKSLARMLHERID